MTPGVAPHPVRRSTRVSWRVRARLASAERNHIDECETLVVNLHGCALQSPRPLRPGTPIQLEVGRRAFNGEVMDSVPLDEHQTRWMLGIALEQVGNHWGIQYPPEDWGATASLLSSTITENAPRQTQAAPGPLVGDASRRHVAVDGQSATDAPVPPQPELAPQAMPVALPQPVPQAAPPISPAPAATAATEAALQEMRAQLLQLQQAQAKQEAMLLQERTERQAARSSAEQAVADQLERVRQAKEYVESLVCSFPSIIEAQAQEQAQKIVRKLQPQTSRAEIEKAVRDAQQRSDAALEQRLAQLSEELRRQVEQIVDERRQAAEAAWAEATGKLQALEDRANHLVALVDVEMQKHAEEIVAETIAEIRALLPQAPAAMSEPRAAGGHPELEALLLQAGEVTAELRHTLKAVQQEHRMNEAATARLQHRAEAVQAWLAGETEKFQEAVHEAFLDAGGEIRGRIAQAVETAGEPLEACSREIEQQITAVARRHVDELHQHTDVGCERLESCSEQARAAIAADMQARVNEALDSFAQDAQRVMQHSMERWQFAVTQTLAAIPKLLADHFAAER